MRGNDGRPQPIEHPWHAQSEVASRVAETWHREWRPGIKRCDNCCQPIKGELARICRRCASIEAEQALNGRLGHGIDYTGISAPFGGKGKTYE
jgi:hypothetical protein